TYIYHTTDFEPGNLCDVVFKKWNRNSHILRVFSGFMQLWDVHCFQGLMHVLWMIDGSKLIKRFYLKKKNLLVKKNISLGIFISLEAQPHLDLKYFEPRMGMKRLTRLISLLGFYFIAYYKIIIGQNRGNGVEFTSHHISLTIFGELAGKMP
ncbi:hypothetical protein ACJX0J_030385, partial [Zea mays]